MKARVTLRAWGEYVRCYKNGSGNDGGYDVNGVIHLMLAALDNLREHQLDADLDQISAAISREQRAHLIQIGQYLQQV